MVAYYYEGPKSESSPCSPGVKYSLGGNLVASPEIAGVSRGSQVIHYRPVTMWKSFFFFSQFSITAHPCRVLCEKKVNWALGRKRPFEISFNGGRNSADAPCTVVSPFKTNKSPVAYT